MWIAVLYLVGTVICSTVPVPAPVPIPAPAPTYCLRQYSGNSCNGTLLQELSLPISVCTNATLVGRNTTKSMLMGLSFSMYLLGSCVTTVATFPYQTCYELEAPTGSLFANPFPCTQPNQPAPTPTPTTTVITSTTNPQSNCAYFHSTTLCSTSPVYWYSIPCGPVCTQLTPTLYVSGNCATNITALYTDESCSNFYTASTQAICGTFALNSGYRSWRVQYNQACPPLPSSPPLPPPTPTPVTTSAASFCRTVWSSPGCNVGFLSQTTGTCQSCIGSVYDVDCIGNLVTRYSTAGCTGSTVLTTPFGVCSNFGGTSQLFEFGACIVPAPVPAPIIPPPQCATFWKTQTCTGISTVTASSNLQCFNSSVASLGASFFASSIIKSFILDCSTGLARLYGTTTCTGSFTTLVFNSASCVGWLISNNLDLSTNNISCSNCISVSSETKTKILCLLLTLPCSTQSSSFHLPCGLF